MARARLEGSVAHSTVTFWLAGKRAHSEMSSYGVALGSANRSSHRIGIT